jgi:hypothetical protein
MCASQDRQDLAISASLSRGYCTRKRTHWDEANSMTDIAMYQETKWRRVAETFRTSRVRKAKGRPSLCEAPTGAKPGGRQREVRSWRRREDAVRTGSHCALGWRAAKRKQEWRRGWDSNPRWSCPHAAFRVRYFRPLSHLSASLVGAALLRGRFHNLAAPLAQEGSLPVCCQTWPNRQFGLTHDPVSRISRPECGVGLPAPLVFVWANRRSGSPAGFTRQCPPMDPADSFRLAKRRPAARREPDEHERTKDVRSH